MEIKSLGLQSEIFFYKVNSLISDRQNYLKIETPNNPNYFWGNLLIFNRPPIDQVDYLNWINLFEKEFSSNLEIKHMTFTWDIYGEKPNIDIFLKNGFTLEETIVLTTTNINLEFENKNYIYKKIESAEDWKQVIDLQIKVGVETDKYIEEKYRPFVINRFHDYQKMVNQGLGNWFGAFEGEKLIADLGLFGNSEFNRFQSIETDFNYRKQGIAQNLIAFAASVSKSKKYIMHAEQMGPAIDMYMRLGFEIKEVISGVCLYNKKIWKSQ